jgi:hypothetical protein
VGDVGQIGVGLRRDPNDFGLLYIHAMYERPKSERIGTLLVAFSAADYGPAGSH